MRKNINNSILIFLIIISLNFFSTAQSNRGVVVKVRNDLGIDENIELYKGSYAIVIGAVDYKPSEWTQLNGVRTDVVEVEKTLKKHGFLVETLLNPTSETLLPTLNKFVNKYGLDEENRLLIYFAGHGYTETENDGRNFGYIVPIDAPNPTKNKIEFKAKAVIMDEIETVARRIRSKHALFIFDSCFSGTLISRGNPKIPPFINYLLTQPVRQFITSGQANQEVPDESIFRQMFVRALEGEADEKEWGNGDGFITGTELYNYLLDRVIYYRGESQTPQYGKIRDPKLDRGDFVFSLNVKSPVIPNKPPVTINLPSITSKLLNYKEIRSIENGNFIVSVGDNYGVIDSNGNEKVKPVYKSIDTFSNNVYLTSKDGNFGLTDLNGNQIIKHLYDSISKQGENSLIVESEGKQGLIDFSGRILLPIKYDDIKPFDQIISILQNNKWGFANQTGKILIQPKYDEVESAVSDQSEFGIGENTPFIKTMIGSGNNLKYGLVDAFGKEIVSPKYEDIGTVSEGVAWVTSNGKQGFINQSGLEITPIKYDSVGSFSEGLAWVSSGNKQGFIDKSGKTLIPLIYDTVESFSNGLAWVTQNNKYGFIDKTGRIVIPIQFGDADSFNQLGFSKVRIRNDIGPQGLIDKTGKEIIPIKYDNIYNYRNNLGIVQLNNKFGLFNINTQKELTPINYDSMDFIWEKGDPETQNENLIQVSNQELVGLIDNNGKQILPVSYISISSFENNLAVVSTTDKKRGVIDKTGKFVISPTYDDVGYGYYSPIFTSNNLIQVRLEKKWGLINSKGEVLVQPKYDSIENFSSQFLLVKIGEKRGFIDQNGKEYF